MKPDKTEMIKNLGVKTSNITLLFFFHSSTSFSQRVTLWVTDVFVLSCEPRSNENLVFFNQLCGDLLVRRHCDWHFSWVLLVCVTFCVCVRNSWEFCFAPADTDPHLIRLRKAEHWQTTWQMSHFLFLLPGSSAFFFFSMPSVSSPVGDSLSPYVWVCVLCSLACFCVIICGLRTWQSVKRRIEFMAQAHLMTAGGEHSPAC